LYFSMLSGLFTLQLLSVMLADVCVNSPPVCATTAIRLMKMKTDSQTLIEFLLPTITSYADSLAPEALDERQRVHILVEKLNSVKS
jgi:hypothetical protein